MNMRRRTTRVGKNINPILGELLLSFTAKLLFKNTITSDIVVFVLPWPINSNKLATASYRDMCVAGCPKNFAVIPRTECCIARLLLWTADRCTYAMENCYY